MENSGQNSELSSCGAFFSLVLPPISSTSLHVRKDVEQHTDSSTIFQIHGRIYYEDFVRMMTGKIGRAQKKVSRRMSGEVTSPMTHVDQEEEEDVETRGENEDVWQTNIWMTSPCVVKRETTCVNMRGNDTQSPVTACQGWSTSSFSLNKTIDS